jgi:hypothetical protein
VIDGVPGPGKVKVRTHPERGVVRQLPPVVYLPVLTDPSSGEPRVAFQRTDDGRVALMVYTAFDRFHECAGETAPWVLIKARDLPGLLAETPFDI